MNSTQQDLVQSSFAKVAPISDQAAVIFYDDLFQRDPKLRAMFKGDMKEQRRKLMAMLATAVANLRSWEKVAPAVRALGAKHVSYGVQAQDYQTVGLSLIATLEKGLGPDFTSETKEAWNVCLATVVTEMLAGASDATVPSNVD